MKAFGSMFVSCCSNQQYEQQAKTIIEIDIPHNNSLSHQHNINDNIQSNSIKSLSINHYQHPSQPKASFIPSSKSTTHAHQRHKSDGTQCNSSTTSDDKLGNKISGKISNIKPFLATAEITHPNTINNEIPSSIKKCNTFNLDGKYNQQSSAYGNAVSPKRFSKCIVIRNHSEKSLEAFLKTYNYIKSPPSSMSQKYDNESVLFTINSTKQHIEDKDTIKNSGNNVYNNWSLKVILDDDIKNNHRLLIENIKGNLIKENEPLIINAAGLINGLRNKRDGSTFFGYNQSLISNEILNDYLFNDPKYNHNSQANSPQSLFSIAFDINNQTYSLQPYFKSSLMSEILKQKPLIYIKIQQSLLINQIKFIQVNKTLIIIEPNGNRLSINVFSKKQKNHTTYDFNNDQVRSISLGMKECDVLVDEEYFNGYIEYDYKEESWVMFVSNDDSDNDNDSDSDSIVDKENKRKCNVWMVLNKKTELFPYDDWILKIESDVIKISIV